MSQSIPPAAIERIEARILEMRAASASFETQDALSAVLDMIADERIRCMRDRLVKRAKKLGVANPL